MDFSANIKEIYDESLTTKTGFFTDGNNISLISRAVSEILVSLKSGGKVIVFGNGGSAADSQHLAAELVVRFEKDRKSLPAIALTTDTSIITSCANDLGFDDIYSRQVESLAHEKDIIVAISTSGDSPNVLKGARAAKKKNIKVVSLSGKGGGALKDHSDIAIVVASGNTARIQEVHVVIIHAICKLVEDAMEGI